jgi:hypothetical protein
MKIISVAGARPNFMKIAPFIKAIQNYNQQLSNNSNEQSSSSEKTGDSSKSPSGGFRGLHHLLPPARDFIPVLLRPAGGEPEGASLTPWGRNTEGTGL